MQRPKLAMTACLGALVLCGLLSASASGATAGWMVNGTMLSGSKALASTAAVDETWNLKAAGVTIQCAGSITNSVGAEIDSPTGGAVGKLEFNGCSANENCKVATTIGSLPLIIDTTLDGTLATSTTFLPKTKTTFATFKYEGEACALLGVQPVTGKISSLVPTGQDERTLQSIHSTVTAVSGELKVGSSAAELKGTILSRLASSETWSFL